MAEADRVSVGSIAHILQTTFRELYVRPEEPETADVDDAVEGDEDSAGSSGEPSVDAVDASADEANEGSEAEGEGEGEEGEQDEPDGGEPGAEDADVEAAAESDESAEYSATFSATGLLEAEVDLATSAMAEDEIAAVRAQLGELESLADQRVLLAAAVAVAPPVSPDAPAPRTEEELEALEEEERDEYDQAFQRAEKYRLQRMRVLRGAEAERAAAAEAAAEAAALAAEEAGESVDADGGGGGGEVDAGPETDDADASTSNPGPDSLAYLSYLSRTPAEAEAEAEAECQATELELSEIEELREAERAKLLDLLQQQTGDAIAAAASADSDSPGEDAEGGSDNEQAIDATADGVDNDEQQAAGADVDKGEDNESAAEAEADHENGQILPREELVARLVAIGAGAIAWAEANEPQEVEDVSHVKRGEERDAAIVTELQRQLSQSEALVDYLERARKASIAADAEVAARLKAEGLLVQSQFPVGPSNLQVEERDLEQFGHFGKSCLTARSLLRANFEKMIDRTQSKTHKTVRYVEEVPGYLKDTQSNAKRSTMLSATSTAQPGGFQPGPASITNRVRDFSRDEKTVRRRKRALAERGPIMGAEELEVNHGVLRRMNQKLQFMRNPRHDGTSSSTAARSLLRAPAVPDTNDDTAAPVTREKAEGEFGHFLASPPGLLFDDYKIGVVYEQVLLLRNVSSVSRRLRVLPPATSHFALERIEYAGGADGTLAPGMACRCLLRFAPDSLADYEDHITLLTEAGKYKVMIEAKREPPNLTIPQSLDAGHCLFGADTTATIECANYGGTARFRMLPEEEWPEPKAAHRGAMLSIPPFEVSPTEFELNKGESIDMRIKFSPQSVGEHSRKFVMVCDNCQVKVFTVSGNCTRVRLELAAIGDVRIDLSTPDSVAPDMLLFDALPPGAHASQRFEVRNCTPIELPFAWDLERTAAGGGADGNGDHDLVLGGQPVFAVEPSSGTLPAGGCAPFTVNFTPCAVRNYLTAAKIMVQDVPLCATEVRSEVGYTRECADIGCLGMRLVGAGEACVVEMDPPFLHFPGVLLPTKTYRMKTRLRNLSVAGTSFDFGAARGPSATNCTVSITPPSGTLDAREETEVELELQPHEVGPLELQLPCAVEHSGGARFALMVDGTVEGPRVTICSPEIDFGLISVGGRSERTLTFVNESEVSAEWSWAQVAEDGVPPSAPSVPDARRGSVVGPPPQSTLSVEPNSGVLPPYGQCSVQVSCIAGQPERVRSALRCSVAHSQDQYVSVRGEVQSPRVYLDQLKLALGTTYVGVPVTRRVRLTNLSNLPADFEWDAEPPSGPSKLIGCTFEPSKGTLPPKGEQEFTVTCSPKAAGKEETLFVCNVKGMLVPLGFELTTLVKGLVMSYELLAEGEEPPPSLLDSTPAGEEVVAPPPSKAPKLAFPGVELFERRKVRLLMRNFSGIPTSFAVEARKYRYEAPRVPRRPGDLLRADHEEEKFKSELGSTYITRKNHRRLDAQALAGGKGVALVAEPHQGTIMPWENVVVEVTLFNDMPGAYKDDLLVDVRGAPTARLPVIADVRGCPLSLAKDCVGLDSLCVPPTLRWGELPINNGREAKSIRVVNDGPVDALVRWRLSDVDGGDDRLVDVDLEVDDDGVVAFKLGYHEKEEIVPPFDVEPREQLVPAHYSASFKVALHSLEEAGPARGLLTADAEWQHPAQAAEVAGGGAAAAKALTTLEKSTSGCLKLELAATSLEPKLSLDKAGAQGVGFKTWSIHDEREHESYRRSVVLTNRMARAAEFSLAIVAEHAQARGVFTLTRTHCLTPHPLDVAGSMFRLQPSQNVTADLHFRPSASGAERSRDPDVPASLQAVHEGAVLRVAFANGSRQDLQLRGLVSRPLVVAAPAELSFGEQHVEGVAVAELWLTNPSEVDAHWRIDAIPAPVATTRAQKALETAVARRAGGALPTDDPGAFSFDVTEGLLCGPTLPIDSSGTQLPTDANRRPDATIQARDERHRQPLRIGVSFRPRMPVAYKCRFRFSVQDGPSFDVVLQGRGSLAETQLRAPDPPQRLQSFPRRLPNF